MPVTTDIAIPLGKSTVLRYLKVANGTATQLKLSALLDELLAKATESQLLSPTIAYERFAIDRTDRTGLYLENGTALRGSFLPALLGTSEYLVAAICTIGPKLEATVTEYFAGLEKLRGLVLDAIGSAAARRLRQIAWDMVRDMAAATGYHATPPLSPGCPGWPITEQRLLLPLLSKYATGVSLTQSAMLVPRKSVSMVTGLSTDAPAWTETDRCSHCARVQVCHNREATETIRGPGPAHVC